MPENYYSNEHLESFPDCELAILQVVQLYICGLLYPEDSFDDAQKRFIMADIGAGDGETIRRSIEFFNSSNANFPFTAYNLGDIEQGEYKSKRQCDLTYYSKQLDCYVSAIPSKLQIPMVSFFTTPTDYYTARVKFDNEAILATRLKVPVYVNDVLTFFYINVDISVNKGSLAYELEQSLSTGNIYNLEHSFDVSFNLITLMNKATHDSSYLNVRRQVRYVDDLIFSLKELDTNQLVDEVIVNTIPNVIGCNISDEQTDVLVDTNIIITFNNSMNEQSVFNNIDIFPKFSSKMEFNTNSTVLTITPYNNLQNDTDYEILINTNAVNVNTHNIENEFNITFRTEV